MTRRGGWGAGVNCGLCWWGGGRGLGVGVDFRCPDTRARSLSLSLSTPTPDVMWGAADEGIRKTGVFLWPAATAPQPGPAHLSTENKSRTSVLPRPSLYSWASSLCRRYHLPWQPRLRPRVFGAQHQHMKAICVRAASVRPRSLPAGSERCRPSGWWKWPQTTKALALHKMLITIYLGLTVVLLLCLTLVIIMTLLIICC